MNDRVVVIISTADRGKAQTGAMFAVNSLKHGWLADVRLFFFGPAENLLLEDPDLQELLYDYHRQDRTAVACRFLAERDGSHAALSALGVQVEFVGSMIADLIKDGYTPMVW
jgi:hypothetical protein